MTEFVAPELFTETVTHRADKAHGKELAVAGETILETSRSKMVVRHQGGFITELNLSDQTGGDMVPIFFAGDASLNRVDATFTMSPVGPHEDLGGQHGAARWADRYPFVGDAPIHVGVKRASFQAKRSDDGPTFLEQYELGWSDLHMTSTILNNGKEPLRTSLGIHCYFAVAEERASQTLLNRLPLSQSLGEGVIEKVMAGEPYLWEKPGNEFELEFADGRRMELFTGGYMYDLEGRSIAVSSEVSLLVWHRKGTDSFCLEPVLGFGPDGKNDGLGIQGWGRADMVMLLNLIDSGLGR